MKLIHNENITDTVLKNNFGISELIHFILCYQFIISIFNKYMYIIFVIVKIFYEATAL